MSKLLCQLSILLLLLAYFSKADKDEEKVNEPPIEQDLPLVLINTGTKKGIRLPTEVEIKLKKPGLLGEKKKIIQFSIWLYFDQGFYCPLENDEQRSKIEDAIKMQNEAEEDTMKEEIDEQCLVKKQQTGVNALAPQCQVEPRPKIMKVFNESLMASNESNEDFSKSGETPCGASGIGEMLGVGYQVCFEYEGLGNVWKLFKKKTEVHPLKSTKELLFYNICYSERTSEILYTKHTIRGSSLFTDPLLENDRKKTWPMETYNTIHIPHIKFELVKLRFEQVEKISDFRIQLLVHPDDFAMGLWKKPAYHFANVSLIHKDLQQCWNSMHKKIQEHIWETPKYLSWNYFDIFTGAFMSPETGLPKVVMNDVPIPKIWVKIVYDLYSVVLIANNYRNEVVDKIITEEYKCKENLCEDFIEKNCPNVSNDIRCCPLTDEIQALFGTKLEYTYIRKIGGLVVVKEKPIAMSGSSESDDSSNYGGGGGYGGGGSGSGGFAFGLGLGS